MRPANLCQALLALLALACASPQTRETAPTTPVAQVAPEASGIDAYDDPETKRFVTAYTRLFCKANYGYDPDSTIATLREPIKRMKRLKEDGSDLLVGYMAVLTDTGFASLGAFDDAAARLRADEELWYHLQSKLMDSLATCQ